MTIGVIKEFLDEFLRLIPKICEYATQLAEAESVEKVKIDLGGD